MKLKVTREKCIDRLRRVGLPKHIMQSLIQTKNEADLVKILNTLPPALLIKARVVKTEQGDDYLVKKSVKDISTPMRD